MSDSADMDTIAALLGNLIERIEKIEERQKATVKVMIAMKDVMEARDKDDQKFRDFTIASFKSMAGNFDKIASQYDLTQRTLTSEDTNARRHGEINEWTGDLSRKLSEMQLTLDRMEGGKKRGIFG